MQSRDITALRAVLLTSLWVPMTKISSQRPISHDRHKAVVQTHPQAPTGSSASAGRVGRRGWIAAAAERRQLGEGGCRQKQGVCGGKGGPGLRVTMFTSFIIGKLGKRDSYMMIMSVIEGVWVGLNRVQKAGR